MFYLELLEVFVGHSVAEREQERSGTGDEVRVA